MTSDFESPVYISNMFTGQMLQHLAWLRLQLRQKLELKSREFDQLVKHKDIGIYLQLYISKDHEENSKK